MANHVFERTGLKQPCEKDCPGRKAGCAVGCEKWRAYLQEREAMYEKRRRQSGATQYSSARRERRERFDYKNKAK